MEGACTCTQRVLSDTERLFSEYYAKIEKLVAANGSPKLHPQKSTENSRLIIALSSIGRDARSVAGFDLTAPLGDFNYVKSRV